MDIKITAKLLIKTDANGNGMELDCGQSCILFLHQTVK